MKILKNIEETGSINQAAKKMKMSYKAVWSKIKATERHFGEKIVIADKKTGTQLTEAGKALLEKYRSMHLACCASADEIFSRFF
jgi:molybdate transport system regulatory protein